MISIIAVIGKNRELGKDNRLLWDIPEDMARFKRLTTGHPVIMGRRTYESIGRPLPGRMNIIVSRETDYHIKGAAVVDSLDMAFKVAEADKFSPDLRKDGTGEIFIIGGAKIYEQSLPYCGKLYLTVVDDETAADVYFPSYEDRFNTVLSREDKESNGLKYTFWELAPGQQQD